MREQAEQLGFVFSRHGCPCSGGANSIFVARHNDTAYTLTIWPRRGVWRLSVKGCKLASGNESNLQTKIQEVWDL
jgi:hypothetical protein